MGFIDTIKARAKADKKTIVLPESEDRRTYEAAAQILKEDLANLVIIGTPEDIGAPARDWMYPVLRSSIRRLTRKHRSISTCSLS